MGVRTARRAGVCPVGRVHGLPKNWRTCMSGTMALLGIMGQRSCFVFGCVNQHSFLEATFEKCKNESQ